MEIKTKTFIRWMGNKSKHLKYIIPYIPTDYDTYIEPFIGSGAVFLKLQPNKWIINDLNKDLINCWLSIKNNPEKIIELFEIFGQDFKKLSNNNKLLYCRQITENLNKLPYDILRATLYMLMKYCVYMGQIYVQNKFYFNSLDLNIITNNSLQFTSEKIQDNFISVNKYLNLTFGKIYNKDYKEILRKVKKGDFVFLDPPYIEEHNYKFNYNKNENLNNNFLNELLLELKKLDKKGIKWLMTQADTKEIKNIFKDYKIIKYPVYRACNKSYVNELIIKNY